MLHFDQKLGDRTHYIGSTTYGRRFARWREHAIGIGGAYTRRFIARGIGFRVVRLWFIGTRDIEKRLKRKGDFSRMCPICNPGLPQITPLHYEANAFTPTIDPGFLQRKRPTT